MRYKKFEEIFILVKKFLIRRYNVIKFGGNFISWKCDIKNLEKISQMKMWYKRFGENSIVGEKISNLKIRNKKFG